MNIDFDEAESGFWEARAVFAMAEQFAEHATRSGDRELISFLQDSSVAHLQLPAYAALRETQGLRDTAWPSWSLLNQFWRRTVGATRAEEALSAQRSDALARADRAEHSAFDAFADSARVTRERDLLRAEVTRLNLTVAQLQAALSATGPREVGP